MENLFLLTILLAVKLRIYWNILESYLKMKKLQIITLKSSEISHHKELSNK